MKLNPKSAPATKPRAPEEILERTKNDRQSKRNNLTNISERDTLIRRGQFRSQNRGCLCKTILSTTLQNPLKSRSETFGFIASTPKEQPLSLKIGDKQANIPIALGCFTLVVITRKGETKPYQHGTVSVLTTDHSLRNNRSVYDHSFNS